MDDFLALFQFRTAAPFGYSIYYLGLILGFAGCAAMVIRSFWRRKIFNMRFGFGLAGALVCAFLWYADAAFSDALEFNPEFSEEDLVGQWQDGNSTFWLKEDGSAEFLLEPDYLARIGIENGSGSWKKVNYFTVAFGNDDLHEGKAPLRVLRYDSELRIIVEGFEDPDMWDGYLGFRRP